MTWRIAQAKQRFSEVLRQAAREPQWIVNRDEPVAVIIDTETYREFQTWHRDRQKNTLAASLAEVRRWCQEEDFTLETLPDSDSSNAFADALDDVPH